MNRILPVVLFLVVSFSDVFAQCTETNQPKVLLVGDSWAWFMNTDGTFNTVLKNWGFSNYKFISNSTLAVNGAQTDDFIKPAAEAEIQNQLNLNPSIEVVHLSIGGNDFLGDWNRNMTQGQTDTLSDAVFVRLDSIIRFIKSCRPDIKILWSGYCYTNFKEVITQVGTLGPLNTNHPFYSTWHGMGDPDFIEINTLQNYISDKITAYCNITPNVYYYNANGLMQYHFGQPSPLLGGMSPTGTYAAHTALLPHGYPDYPSPVNSMRDYGLTKDCYHLSPEGYRYLIGYHTQKFYHKLFMDDLYLLSDSTQTGSVSSTGNVSTKPFVGENGGEQFGTVLSFNTTAMADTTLQKASIFLRRKALTGTNPVTANSFVVKMKNGNFGTTVNVEAADFADAGDANGSACNFGAFANNDEWVRIDLPASILTHINHNSNTQFIVTAPATSGGKVEYYDATDPDFAPVLNLKYGQTPSAVNEVLESQFNIYPNPTNDVLNIESGNETVTHLELTNLLGEVVLQPCFNHNAINISTLSPGVYMLNIATKNGYVSKKIVKE